MDIPIIDLNPMATLSREWYSRRTLELLRKKFDFGGSTSRLVDQFGRPFVAEPSIPKQIGSKVTWRLPVSFAGQPTTSR